MDIGNIKKHSDLNFEVAQAKKNALEKQKNDKEFPQKRTL